MPTLTVEITVPAGTTADRYGERHVIAKLLTDAAHAISGTTATDGSMAHDRNAMGTWTYEPVAQK